METFAPLFGIAGLLAVLVTAFLSLSWLVRPARRVIDKTIAADSESKVESPLSHSGFHVSVVVALLVTCVALLLFPVASAISRNLLSETRDLVAISLPYLLMLVCVAIWILAAGGDLDWK